MSRAVGFMLSHTTARREPPKTVVRILVGLSQLTCTLLAAALFAHESAEFDVHVPAGLGGDVLGLDRTGEAGSGRAGARPPGLAMRGGGSSRAVAGVTGCAEPAGERVDRFEEQRVDAGLLFSGTAGAEVGDRPAVLGLGGELADPGGRGEVHP
jgi:hypothetical protein